MFPSFSSMCTFGSMWLYASERLFRRSSKVYWAKVVYSISQRPGSWAKSFSLRYMSFPLYSKKSYCETSLCLMSFNIDALSNINQMGCLSKGELEGLIKGLVYKGFLFLDVISPFKEHVPDGEREFRNWCFLFVFSDRRIESNKSLPNFI